VRHLRPGGSRSAATSRNLFLPKNPSVHANTEPLAWWLVLLELFHPLFTAPAFAVFQELLTAWVLCPARRTVTGMMRGGGLVHHRPHDAYHRLLRSAAWSLDSLWDLTAELLIGLFAETGRIDLLLDDTLFHRRGRKIDGAGTFRDAVRSSGGSVVYDRGLNLVVLALRVKAPWGGEPLALPLAVRLHRKSGPTLLDLGEAAIRRLAERFPDRSFHLIADGAYAPLAGWELPRTAVTSRIRRDAALYDFPRPPRKGQVGRPPKKGPRLAPLPRWANHTRNGWANVVVDRRGRLEERLLLARVALWYHVCGTRPVRVVVSRDPKGHEKDDFLFTTDLELSPGAIVSHYHGRWPIEETLRSAKQSLGGEEPQTWKRQGPERAASLSFWLYSVVWAWYLESQGPEPRLVKLPWYPKKVRPSFLDAMSALRGELWRSEVSSRSEGEPRVREITQPLVEALALSR
jgi:DDE superfamily endonuclease